MLLCLKISVTILLVWLYTFLGILFSSLKICEPGAGFAGRMRCLAALARWEELNNLCKEYWTPAEPAARLEMAPMVGFIPLPCVSVFSPACAYGDCFVRLQVLLGTWENGIKWQNMYLD